MRIVIYSSFNYTIQLDNYILMGFKLFVYAESLREAMDFDECLTSFMIRNC